MENKIIRIVSAHRLSEAQKVKLEEVFRFRNGEEVEFIYEIDEDVIGGLKIIDGYDVFDATVISKVKSIKNQLK